MADDTDDRSALGSLQAREDFRGFKESMLLYALEKGDVEMIGPFRTPSLDDCRFSHDAVDKGTDTRFVYSVTDASAATFVKVLEQFIAFIGTIPGSFVIKILRADQGSNYTSSTVRQFLAARGIKLQLAAVHTPHQIRVVETAHSVINSTMRAIMYFANAPREIWALGRRYSALLNNMMATRYNQGSKAIIPLLALGVKIDFASLLPFGCLVMCHRAKEQVKDGYCDTRGVEGAFVGYSWMDGVKGLMVYLSTGKIVTTVFWKADATYFPWRPDGQRRLKSDGSFGDEGETARVFSQIPGPYSFNEILEGAGDIDQEEEISVPNQATQATAGGETGVLCKSPYSGTSNSGYEQLDSTTGAGDAQKYVKSGPLSSCGGANSQSGTADQDVRNDISGIMTQNEHGKQIERELERGSRICFQFDSGPAVGKYLVPSMRRTDAGQDLPRVSWDDKTNYLVKFSPENRFGGDDSGQMKPGEWMV